uniref:DUF834 domain-containing protein n=1 Tax=Oryza sativa subsp. japonica TaxID=39947 RepID=Q6UUP9_ORYSJ|nr:hypothetical protein OSJNBa0079I01.38 [Oryza sativa Japonica Group]
MGAAETGPAGHGTVAARGHLQTARGAAAGTGGGGGSGILKEEEATREGGRWGSSPVHEGKQIPVVEDANRAAAGVLIVLAEPMEATTQCGVGRRGDAAVVARVGGGVVVPVAEWRSGGDAGVERGVVKLAAQVAGCGGDGSGCVGRLELDGTRREGGNVGAGWRRWMAVAGERTEWGGGALGARETGDVERQWRQLGRGRPKVGKCIIK